MAKRHHLIDVGMLGVTARSLADLRREFIDIYTGEPDADAHPYQACNGVQSWGNGSMWGVGDPEGRNRVRTNVAAWLGFLEQLRDANEAVGGGNLRAIISRALVGLHVVRHWSLAEIGEYAHRLCEGIAQRELDRLVLGWWTDDEGIEKPTHTVEVWRKVLAATHDAQRQAGCRFPFYWAEEIGSSPYWALTGAGWRHDIPQKLRDWVSAFAEPDFPVLHDASGVFMP
ncbi:hypothetical protein FJZ36_18415, partial [Candidatus Poribacteria bacterium]|nr:hypothetical protein [Candidatus Poribacteria bacterium]